MEQQCGYREGIEDSIRRCEELLALAPLAFVPADAKATSCGSRRAHDIKQARPTASQGSFVSVNVDIRRTPSSERVWRKNMDLLSGSSTGHPLAEEDASSKAEPSNVKQKCEDSSLSERSTGHPFAKEDAPGKAELSNVQKCEDSSLSERSRSTSGQTLHSEAESFARTSVQGYMQHRRRSGRDSEWSCTSEDWNFESLSQGNCTPSSCNAEPDGSVLNCQAQGALGIMIMEPKDRRAKLDTAERVTAVQDCQSSLVTENAENVIATNYAGGQETDSSVSFSGPDETEAAFLGSKVTYSGEAEDESKAEVPDSGEEMGRGKSDLVHSLDINSSESQVPTLPSGLGTLHVREDDSTPELQTSVSGDSQVIIDSRWEGVVDISERSHSSDPEHKTESSCGHLENQQKFEGERRSKSAPRESRQGSTFPKHQRSKSVAKECSKDRLKTLSRPRTAVYKKLAELKALLEAEQLQECSFKPIVGRKPDPESPHSAPIFERILEIQQRLELRKRARKAHEKEELDNCSFWPRINWRSQFLDKITYQPIEKRFQELQRQKVEKLANAQLRKDLGLTFKPEINQKSVQLCKQKGLETIDVADRLTTMHPSFHLDCKLEPEKSKITFTPEINKNTDYIIASSKKFGGWPIGFFQRQQQYLQTLEEKKKSKEIDVPTDITFRPNIGNSAIILKHSPCQDVFQETVIERVERLAYKDKERLWHAREKVAEAYYAQFNFQPEIDNFSRVLAPQTSVQDLFLNEKGKKVKEALEQAAQEEFQHKCPFRPEVNASTCSSASTNLESVILQRRKFRKAYALPTRQYTIPRPFLLQTAQVRCQRRPPSVDSSSGLATQSCRNSTQSLSFSESGHQASRKRYSIG